MRIIGQWIRSLDDTDFFPPQEFVGDLGQDVRESLAAYLERGGEYCKIRGSYECLICGLNRPGVRELTDGMWVWREELAHYVVKHNILLPDEFIQQVMRPQETSRPVVFDKFQPLDNRFWSEWCRARVSPDYFARLEAARAELADQHEHTLRVRAAEMTQKLGVSDQRCQWVGCTERALVGRRLCGYCIVRGDYGSCDISVLIKTYRR